MNDFSLHILDLVENSLAAGADNIVVALMERGGRKVLAIRDNGRGLPEIDSSTLLSPFYTTRTTRRVGLGLGLLEHLSRLCDGWTKVLPVKPKGTVIVSTFTAGHWDLPPDGDVAATILTLVSTNPQCRFRLIYGNPSNFVQVDSRDLEGMTFREKKGWLANTFTGWEGFKNGKSKDVG